MHKIFIKTYGCAFNQSDSQIMAGLLEKSGFEILNSQKDAEIVIINSCTVKNMSEVKLFNDVKKLKEQNKIIIVAGCVPQAQPSYLKTKLNNITTIGTNDIDRIVEIVEQTIKGETPQIITSFSTISNPKQNEEKENVRLCSPKFKKNNLIEIIPVNEGCLGSCSYCKTKQARGNLVSYSIEGIKQAMKKAIDNGAKEIYLTSQDIACYGMDIKTSLPELLRELLKIEGDYKIRIGMGNPNHFKNIIDEIVQIIKNDNIIYKFLHIPIQSASNKILNEMRRRYNYEEYKDLILKIKKEIPNLTIATDIIVAYPKETESDFKETINFLNELKPNVLNFSRFWPRPQTFAAENYRKTDYIGGKESKNRARILKEEFKKNAFENNKKWIGWVGDVLITETGKRGTNTLIGRNEYYKPIIIKNLKNKIKIGDKIKIKINNVTWFDFHGEIC